MADTPPAPRGVAASLGATLPAGWAFKESLTLLAPDGQANVIVSSEPVAPDLDGQTYAAVQGELLRKEFPGYVELELEPTQAFGGLPAWRRRFTWTPPDGREVTQVQVYAATEGRGYTATATSPSVSFTSYERELAALLDSIVRTA